MEEEIDLKSYLRVIGKRKWIIIVGTFFCIIVAGIVGFIMPKIYEVSTSIKIGKIGETEFGETEFVEEPTVVISKIKSISLRRKIAEELSFPFEEISEKKFKVSSEGDKNVSVITTKIETDKPEQGIKILEIINQTIFQGHLNKIEQTKKEILDKIAIDQIRIEETETQIKSLKKELSDKIAINENQIKIKEKEQKSLEKRLTDIEKEIKELQKIRDRITKKKTEKVDVVGMVAYFNDFQTRLNSLYSTQSQINDSIPSQIQSYKENIAALQGRLVKLDDLPIKIQSYKENIVSLQGKLEKISEIEVIDPPHSSYYPIKPKKKFNIVIAMILGLMIFTFVAFFQEYLSK